MTQRFGGIYSPLRQSEFFKIQTIMEGFDEFPEGEYLHEMPVSELIDVVKGFEREYRDTIRPINRLDKSKADNIGSARQDLIFLGKIRQKLERWQKRFAS